MNFLEFLGLFSSESPPQIKVTDSQRYIQLGDETIPVNGEGVVEFPEHNISVIGDKDGATPRFFFADGGELTAHKAASAELQASGSTTPNECLLDELGTVFTRSDVLESQVELLNMLDQHRSIIRRLRKILQAHRRDDIIGLVTSASIIRREDELANKARISYLRGRLSSTCGTRGSMIYNLFRSGILENEIVTAVSNVDGDTLIRDAEGVATPFLEYWDSVLIKGYPSAYFVKFGDSESEILAEVTERLNQSNIAEVRIFSRSSPRNKVVRACCELGKNDLEVVDIAKYKLGHDNAITATVRRPTGS